VRVDLYDRRDRFLAEASAQNEGKLHLGYVDAADSSMRTARTMARGGLSFAPLLRRWLGEGIDTVPVSTPFTYVVHRSSMLAVDTVRAHLEAAHAIALEELAGAAPDYFGADPRARPELLPDSKCDELFDRRTAAAAFRTQEIGIDPEALAELVRARLESDDRITCVRDTHVRGVSNGNGNGLSVSFEADEGEDRVRYDHVVNTLWDGRLAVDRTAGLEPERGWLFRLKQYLRVRAPGLAGRIPSTTIVLGAFGDTVS
jgi:FAD dependent oxidoreductase